MNVRSLVIPVAAIAASFAAGVAITARTAQSEAPAAPMTKSMLWTWEKLEPKATKVGARREVARFPTTTLAEFESHITTLNPGEKSHDPHTHVNEEVLILREGTAEAYVNGEWKPMTTGSMVLMGSMVPHAIRNSGKTPCTYYVINWKTKTEGGATAAAK